MHPARERAFIDMQCRALQHLAQRRHNLRCACALNVKGEAFTAVTAADGTQRLVWLLSYVPGTMLTKARRIRQSYCKPRAILGRDGRLACRFFHPQYAASEVGFDARGMDSRAFLHHVRDGSSERWLRNFWRFNEVEVLPRLSRQRRSVVYGDANH